MTESKHDAIAALLQLSEDQLLLRLVDTETDGAIGRNLLKVARRKYLIFLESIRPHVCENREIKKLADRDSDVIALAILFSDIIPQQLFDSNGIGDSLAASVILAKMGLHKLCGPDWNSK